jgi:hypothetical protein
VDPPLVVYSVESAGRPPPIPTSQTVVNSATWGSPVSRELAEAKADQIIKATRPHWGWFIVFMIVALLWVWFIASTYCELLANWP